MTKEIINAKEYNTDNMFNEVFAYEADMPETAPQWVYPEDEDSSCNRPYYETNDGVIVIEDPWGECDD